MLTVNINYVSLAIIAIYLACALSFDGYLWFVYNQNQDLFMIALGSCLTEVFGVQIVSLYLHYKLFTTNDFNPLMFGVACVFLLINFATYREKQTIIDRFRAKA